MVRRSADRGRGPCRWAGSGKMQSDNDTLVVSHARILDTTVLRG
ncbi:MAG TPA: hypothetical protein VFX04_09885 [Rhodanobacteraceae bacterium]|nr:hypothetical protein [Rhodanobacteraceae bacterium]